MLHTLRSRRQPDTLRWLPYPPLPPRAKIARTQNIVLLLEVNVTTRIILGDSARNEVRTSIQDGATLNMPYILMNVAAATIASYGLFANSPAVVIGAMIVAMLLGPITGVALGLVDGDNSDLFKALGTLFAGVACVASTGLVLGIIHSDIPITDEILARTAPNLTDLMIALAGGAAGAYATVSPRLSVAFVGVAIATALVPPLCAASILVARSDYDLGYGALLLTFTNIVAIQFASSVVLWLTGFRRSTTGTGFGAVNFLRRNLISIVLIALLAVLLTKNLREVIVQQVFEDSVRHILRDAVERSPGNYLADVRFSREKTTLVVRAVIRGPRSPSVADVAALAVLLPSSPDKQRMDLRVRAVATETITPQGVLYEGEKPRPGK